jgi:aminodeoxyfutalosine synthase
MYYCILFLFRTIINMNSAKSLLLNNQNISPDLKEIADKVFSDQRITNQDALTLFEKGELPYLGVLGNYVREKLHGNKTYFNRNFHIEPTNICIYNCKFCSYVRKINEEGAWEYTPDEIIEKVKEYENIPVTEVHIVGGVHPKRDLDYYGTILKRIKALRSDIHIKAFTAVELEFMIKKAKLSLEEGLKKLKRIRFRFFTGCGC